MTVDCGPQAEFGTSPYIRAFFDLACKERLPMFGSFDLTYRCNFRCQHCYAGHLVGQSESRAAELSTDEVVGLLTAAADAGCLFMLLSGGEPLLRADFLDIYRAAKRLGLIVSLFTNASLIDERHAEVFNELPPHMVEVSVYGASEWTCARVTGRAGVLEQTRRGVELLVQAGVPVLLKTMILRDNLDEVLEMERWADSLGLRFRLDPVITPRLDGDPGPLGQRAEPEMAVAVELSTQTRRRELREFVEKQTCVGAGPGLPATRTYRCGAGLASFHLDPEGYMRPCLMSRTIAHDTTTLGFAAAWKAVADGVDHDTWDGVGGCAECHDYLLCGYCPGLFALEGASPAEPPEYLCRLGRSRYSAISSRDTEAISVG